MKEKNVKHLNWENIEEFVYDPKTETGAIVFNNFMHLYSVPREVIDGLISLGLDIKIGSKKEVISMFNRVKRMRNLIIGMLAIEILVGGYVVEKASTFTEYQNLGIDSLTSFKLSFMDQTFIDERTVDIKNETHHKLKTMYPDIQFNEDGNVIVVDGLPQDNAAGIFTTAGNSVIVSKDYIKYATAHEVVHQMLSHERYTGLCNHRTGYGRAINEGLTDYLIKGEGYKEKEYIDLLRFIIPLDSIVKIAAEGKTEDLQQLLFKYTDKDIIKMIDDDHLKQENVLAIRSALYEAFYNSMVEKIETAIEPIDMSYDGGFKETVERYEYADHNLMKLPEPYVYNNFNRAEDCKTEAELYRYKLYTLAEEKNKEFSKSR